MDQPAQNIFRRPSTPRLPSSCLCSGSSGWPGQAWQSASDAAMRTAPKSELPSIWRLSLGIVGELNSYFYLKDFSTLLILNDNSMIFRNVRIIF